MTSIQSADINSEVFRYRPDTQGTIRAMGIDQYPGEMQSVRELIQNADDAEATYFEIHQNTNELLIVHNGKPFTKPIEVEIESESDFIRISRIGLGKNEEEYTGRFGIGFTSVFHITDSPRIVSNGWDFTINVVDELPTITTVPFSKETKIHLPYRLHSTVFSEGIGAEPFDQVKIDSFESHLPLELYHNVFFLKNIRKITSYRKGKLQNTFSKIISNSFREEEYEIHDVIIQKQSVKNGKRKTFRESWKFFSLNNLVIPDYLVDLKRLNNQKVEIALPLSINWKRISRINNDLKYAYYTLPVKQTNYNFKYNSSMFYTTSGRTDFVSKEGLKANWNKWQSDNLAKICIYCIDFLIKKQVNPNYIYYYFPFKSDSENILDKYISEYYNSIIRTQNKTFFYTTKNSWEDIDNIVVNWDGMSLLFTKETNHKFIHNNLKNHQQLFYSLEIEKVGLDLLIQYLVDTYGEKRSSTQSEEPSVINNILDYLGKKTRMSSEHVNKLKGINMILSEENILRSYEYGIYFPTDDNMPLIHKGDIVKKEIYSTRNGYSFLKKKLNIRKINIHSLIEYSFILRIQNYNQKDIDDFIWYLIENQKKVFRKKSTKKLLSENLFKIFKIEKNCDGEDVFYHSKELKQVFKNKINYLSEYYDSKGKKDGKKWKNFFKKIGIKEIPDADYLLSVFNELESQKLDPDYSNRVKKILEYLNKNWRKVYSKQVKKIQQLRDIKWVPTNNSTLNYPLNVYINPKHSILVGETHPFCSIKLPNNLKMVSQLGFKTEPDVDHVIENLLTLSQSIPPKKPSLKIYQYLDNQAPNFITSQELNLSSNRSIWFKGKYWYPKEIFIEDQQNTFGPNGWFRAYLKRNRISKLGNLCEKIQIKKGPTSADDFISWLKDYSKSIQTDSVPERHFIFFSNVYSILSIDYPHLEESQIEEMQNSRTLLTNKYQLVYPKNGFLIRAAEEKIYNRLLLSDYKIDFIFSENVETDAFFLSIGVREILRAISSRKDDKTEPILHPEITQKIRKIVPWLDGFEHRITGKVTDYNLKFQNVSIYIQHDLHVQYTVDGLESTKKSIQDICCVEYDEHFKIVLSDKFSFRVIDHINLLTILLIRYLNPDIDFIQWSLAIPQLLNTQQIFGFSPYRRKKNLQGIQNEREEDPRVIASSGRIRRRDVFQTDKQIDTPIGEDNVIKKWEPELEPEAEGVTIDEIDESELDSVWTSQIEPDSSTQIEVYVPTSRNTDTGSIEDTMVSNEGTNAETNNELLSQKDKTRVGRWGELFALNSLIERIKSEYLITDIQNLEDGYRFFVEDEFIADLIWMNKDNEKYLPYDIHYIGSDHETFFEVKSTITSNKDWFKVSRNQWQFARENKNKYNILRVYNVGTKQREILEYNGLYRLWVEEKITARAMEILI